MEDRDRFGARVERREAGVTVTGVGKEQPAGLQVLLAVIPGWACVERDEQVEPGVREGKGVA